MVVKEKISLVEKILSEEESKDHVSIVKALNYFEPGNFLLICDSDPKWVFPGKQYISQEELMKRLTSAGLNVGNVYREFGCVNITNVDGDNYFMVYKRK